MKSTCAIENCSKPVHGRGWCSTHWARWAKWGDPHKITMRPSGTGHIRKDGYIAIVIKGQPFLQHRFNWIEAYGPIPKGFHVHHINGQKADNRLDNLELREAKEHNHYHNSLRGYKLCSISGCLNLAIARTWCSMHYARWRTHGNPLLTTPPRWWPRKEAIL